LPGFGWLRRCSISVRSTRAPSKKAISYPRLIIPQSIYLIIEKHVRPSTSRLDGHRPRGKKCLTLNLSPCTKYVRDEATRQEPTKRGDRHSKTQATSPSSYTPMRTAIVKVKHMVLGTKVRLTGGNQCINHLQQLCIAGCLLLFLFQHSRILSGWRNNYNAPSEEVRESGRMCDHWPALRDSSSG